MPKSVRRLTLGAIAGSCTLFFLLGPAIVVVGILSIRVAVLLSVFSVVLGAAAGVVSVTGQVLSRSSLPLKFAWLMTVTMVLASVPVIGLLSFLGLPAGATAPDRLLVSSSLVSLAFAVPWTAVEGVFIFGFGYRTAAMLLGGLVTVMFALERWWVLVRSMDIPLGGGSITICFLAFACNRAAIAAAALQAEPPDEPGDETAARSNATQTRGP